jgi:GAF domain-containing protein
LPINVAVKLALSRIQHNIYDPIIVEFEDKSMRLLDMYVLLLTQSQLSNNLSGIVSSLNNIETILSSEKADPITTLDLIMESLNLVVPSHHIRILLQSMPEYDLLSSHELVLYHEELADRNRIFRSVLQMNQAIVAEDVQHVPSWGNSDSPENTRSWMGVPLSNQNGTIGLLSLSRHTFSPFTNNEKELAQVFARYITSLFSTLTRRLEKKHIFQRKY